MSVDQTLDESAGCPFCNIIAGRAPAKILHDAHSAMIIVPLDQVTDGHVMVIPKRHVRDATEDTRITAGVMVTAAAWAARRQQPANIITSIGREATQSVFHLHVHVVPRRDGDGLTLPWTGQVKSGGRE